MSRFDIRTAEIVRDRCAEVASAKASNYRRRADSDDCGVKAKARYTMAAMVASDLSVQIRALPLSEPEEGEDAEA